MRQYRGGWLDAYNQLVQWMRDMLRQFLNRTDEAASDTEMVAKLRQHQNKLKASVQDLRALRTSLAQQQENYPWWVEQMPGDDLTLVQFHQRHLDTALRDLDLLIEKGQTVLEGANTALDQVQNARSVV
jgi:translation initiation factor 2 beta subunit (eIF-2beta)/eIF-5